MALPKAYFFDKQAIMKRSRLTLLIAIMAAGWSSSDLIHEASAIPTSFGGFFGLAGMQLEDFIALPDTWKPGAELKGTWEPGKAPEGSDSSVELQHLTVSALIFGLEASEVTVQRRGDHILQFDAVLKPGKGSSLGQLEKTLRRNLEVWADSKNEDSYRGGAATIKVTPRTGEGEIVVTFSPAAAGKAVSSR